MWIAKAEFVGGCMDAGFSLDSIAITIRSRRAVPSGRGSASFLYLGA